jgi:uncharacterized membrane protein
MEQMVWYLYFLDVRKSVVAFVSMFEAVAVVTTVLGCGLMLFVIVDRLDTIASHETYSGCVSRPKIQIDPSDRLKLRWAKRLTKRSFMVAVACGIFLMIVPSERTLLSFMGVKAAHEIATQVKDDPRIQKVLTIIDAKLDAYIKETEK